MTKIKANINGTIVEIEVEDKFAEQYEEFNKEYSQNEWKYEQRMRRKGVSLESLIEGGYQFRSNEPIPGDPTARELAIMKEQRRDRIRKILKHTYKQLTQEQKILFKRVILGKEKQCDVAEELGIAKQSMSDRIRRIKAKFEKNLKLFLK